MQVIKEEKITESAVLTTDKKLLFFDARSSVHSFLEEDYQTAFQHGKSEGESLGYARALDELDALFGLLQNLTQKLLEQKNRLLDRLKPEIVELAIAISERVIRKELSQPETLLKLIHTLLSCCNSEGNSDVLRITLASEDAAMIERHLNNKAIEGIVLHADQMLMRGDCRIEMRTELLHYSISRELADLQAKILQR